MDNRGRVLGTYVHDLFKNDAVVDKILSNVASMRGSSGQYVRDDFSQDEEYNKLARHLRESLDTGLIYREMGLGIDDACGTVNRPGLKSSTTP